MLVDPEYQYLVINSSVKWDSRTTSLSGSILKAGIINEIIQWSQNNLERFESYFRYSALLRTIDNFDPGVINNDTDVKARQEIVPTLNVVGTYELNFGNPLYHPHVGHQGTLTSTTFNFSGYSGCVFKDNDGVLEIYGNSATGQNVLISSDAGTVNYDTGKVTIIGFSPTAVTGGTLSVLVDISGQDIVPQNNQLITIRNSDLTVTMHDDASTSTGTLQTTRAFVSGSSTTTGSSGSSGSSGY